MSEWAAKRFWKEASAESESGGFAVRLDGRPVRTPAKTPLIVPTKPMANAIAAEWDAQSERIDPMSMPVTRSANAAIDKTGPQKDEVAALITAYGETDLLCYRADSPASLVTAQREAWDPLLDWAAMTLGTRLTLVSGVMFQAQSDEAIETLAHHVKALNVFELTAFHDLVSLSGSLIIGFAAIHNHIKPDALWKISRIDEDWQISQWGVDEEASLLAETKRQAFLHAHRFYVLSQNANLLHNH